MPEFFGDDAFLLQFPLTLILAQQTNAVANAALSASLRLNARMGIYRP